MRFNAAIDAESVGMLEGITKMPPQRRNARGPAQEVQAPMQSQDIPYGYCQCGCGQRAPIAKQSLTRRGHIKGQPMRFRKGHWGKSQSRVGYVVDERSGCWQWTGSVNREGYGSLWADGEHRSAHRYYYEQHYGPIPAGLELDHLCRNPGCVNPEHLEAVTHLENVRRGRRPKLSVDKVRQIRESAAPARELAERYGVSTTLIYFIRKRQRWVQ